MRFMMMIKSDEQAEAGTLPDEQLVAAMVNYNEGLVQAGALLAAEGLHPSSRGARVKFHAGKPTVTDGPFAEAKELIAGYWLIQAKSREEAIEWARKVPFEAGEASHPGGGTAEIELRRVYELEDFPVNEGESGWREREAEHRAEAAPSQHGEITKESAARLGEKLKQFVIFRMADPETEAGLMPEEPLLAAMGQYNEEGIKAGVFLSGEGLYPSSEGARILYSNGRRSVIDGPFAESKELIAGFSLIQARSKEEALSWVLRWPPIDAHGEAELELREVFAADEFGEQLSPELRAAEERQRAQMGGKA